jgi:hypothetical protein
VSISGIEAGASDGDRQRLGATAVGSAGDELMEGLAAVDANVDEEAARVADLVIRGHGQCTPLCWGMP